jgi:hypothetical protein
MMSLLPRPLSGEESVRKQVWVLVLAMWTFLLVGGAGALGQPSKPPAKDYAYRNGKVVIGGDLVVPCRSFAPSGSGFYPRDATGEEQAQAERAMEQCQQAGHVTLPGTGGGSLPLLAAGLLLVCAGLGLVAIHSSA